jgi:hypothetical protein
MHSGIRSLARVHNVQGAEEFFAQRANIQLAIGGPYEIQFDPNNNAPERKG